MNFATCATSGLLLSMALSAAANTSDHHTNLRLPFALKHQQPPGADATTQPSGPVATVAAAPIAADSPYELSLSAGLTEQPQGERQIVHQSATGQRIECRINAGQPDQCVSKPAAPSTRSALTARPTLTAKVAFTQAPNTRDNYKATPQAERILLSSLTFPDLALQKCLTDSASSAGFTYVDQVTSLYCFYYHPAVPISDLTGINQLSALQLLYVGGPNAASPLSGLNQLTTMPELSQLTLERFQISSLSFLHNIPKLRHAGLHRLKVADGWQTLATLDQLESLRHSDDELSDKPDIVSLINQMSGLTSVFLNINNPALISGLNHSGIYDAYLYDLPNLNFISQLPAMRSLTLEQSEHTELDISALQNNTKINTLALTGAAFTPAQQAVIESLPNLMHLGINNTNTVSQLGFINKLTKLYSLQLLNAASSSNLATLLMPASLKELDLSRYTFANAHYARTKSIQSLINNPGPLQTLRLTGQISLPCAELEQISAKIANVQSPASCGISQTMLDDVTIADSQLRACIAKMPNTFLEEIYSLTCQDVASLEGIEHLLNLQTLNINSGTKQIKLSSLKPLEKLKALNYLSLSNQLLTDAAANIQYPASLRSLSLSSSLLSNAFQSTLQPILANLQELNLSGNNISDFSWLSGALQLQRLYIARSAATDFSFLNQLPNLTMLDISSHNLASLSGLSLSATLNYLNLSSTKLTDLSSVATALKNPASLTNLHAGNLPLSTLSHLSSLPNLMQLSLYNIPLTDYSVLGDLSKLFLLNVTGNTLPKKFPDFTVPATLQVLFMSNPATASVNDISELIKAAGQFQNVQLQGQVAINCEQIETLRNHANSSKFMLPDSCGQLVVNSETVPDPVLRQCLTQQRYTIFSNIHYLSCQGNILDWSGVRHMSNLQYVYAYGSATQAQPVKNLAEFNQLSKLQTASLLLQGITDAALGAFSHPTLSYLNLSGNPVSQGSFGPISQNFPLLQYIDLSGSAITSLATMAKLNIPNILLLNNPQLTSYTGLNTLGDKTQGFYLEPVNSAALTGLQLPAQVHSLSLHGSAWTSISQILALLQNPQTLTTLELNTPTLADLTGLNTASWLTGLTLSHRDNQLLTDFSAVASLPALQYLSVNSPKLTSLTPLAGILKNLQYLDLENSKVTDFTLLSTMAKVNTLSLSSTYIRDLTPMLSLANLSYVSLEHNTQLACADLDLLQTKLPAGAYLMGPAFCQLSDPPRFKMKDGTLIVAASFANAADSAKGSLSVVNGQLIFTPAAGISGWVTLQVNITINNYTRTYSITTWVDSQVNPAKKAKGLPWWILTAPRAA